MSGCFERTFSSRIIVDLMIIVKVPISIFVIFVLPTSVRRIATTTLGVLKQNINSELKAVHYYYLFNNYASNSNQYSISENVKQN